MPLVDHSNPLAVSLPYTFNSSHEYPTEMLASRFQAWRLIIKDLVNYLKEFASVEEEIVRQQLRLQQAVGTATAATSLLAATASHGAHSDDLNAINKLFLPIGNGSIQDIPTILTKFHQQNVTNGSKTLKEINSVIIPKLEELRKDLLIKTKEIKNLQNDFKTNLGKEIQETRKLLAQFQQAIELLHKLEHGGGGGHHLLGIGEHGVASGSGGNGVSGIAITDGLNDHALLDPYLVKTRLERQLKRQLLEETYLYDAYANLQNSGGKLELIVVLEIQNYLSMFLGLVENEHAAVAKYLIPTITNGFLSKDQLFEWDLFILRHLPSTTALQQLAVGHLGSALVAPRTGTFIDLSFPARRILDINIPNFDSPLNVAVREGTLERRSKFFKSYLSGWYVLTCNYLHEFKLQDRKRDPLPVMSLLLDACLVSEHSKNDGKAGGVYKFVLYSKGLNLRHRSHNWVFRTDTYKNMIDWYNDIKNLTSLATPAARARLVLKIKGIPAAPKTSRPASILSGATEGRTIHLVDSAETGRATPSVRSKATSNNQRLLSTFLRKNNNSPRLPNMINSDGTIVTPVESERETDPKGQSQPPQQQQQQQPSQPQQQPQQPPQPAVFYTPGTGAAGASAGAPAVGGAPQAYVYPQYIIGGQAQPGQAQPPQPGQPQQFYDPVQQKYYTISPTVQPQPQYFPTSPQPTGQQQFYAVPATNGKSQPAARAASPGGPTGGPAGGPAVANAQPVFFYPQSPQMQPTDVASLGSYIPVPASLQPYPIHVTEEVLKAKAPNDSNALLLHHTVSKDGDIIIEREPLNDVDTLPSAASEESHR